MRMPTVKVRYMPYKPKTTTGAKTPPARTISLGSVDDCAGGRAARARTCAKATMLPTTYGARQMTPHVHSLPARTQNLKLRTLKVAQREKVGESAYWFAYMFELYVLAYDLLDSSLNELVST